MLSHTLSLTMLVPWAMDSSVVIWGCISVGKPGWGMVFTLHLRRGRWQYTRTVSSPSSTAVSYTHLDVYKRQSSSPR